MSTSNHMFRRAILDKLPECIFENFWNFPNKSAKSQDRPNQTCDYSLITLNQQQTLCIETNIF